MRLIVTLVHGTWAEGASWVKAGPLVDALSRLAVGGVRLKSFTWSGRNRHLSRLRAAYSLREHIENCANRFPETRQIIIAHSHGGNVALYALRDPAVRKRVLGLVCLSSPFLHVRPRNLGSAGLFPLVACGSGLLPALGWLVANRLLPSMHTSLEVLSGTILVALVLSTLCFLVRWSGYRMVRELETAASESLPDAVARSFEVPDMRADELLIVRTAGDEATGVLAGSQLLSAIVSRIWLLFAGWFAWAEHFESAADAYPLWSKRHISTGIAAILGMSLTFAVDGYWKPEEWYPTNRIALLVGSLSVAALIWMLPKTIVVLLMCLQIFIGACLIPIAMLICLFLLPFGFEAVFLGLALDVTAEATPPGAWFVQQLALRKTTAPLWHSATYSDPAAINLVCEWVKNKVIHQSMKTTS